MASVKLKESNEKITFLLLCNMEVVPSESIWDEESLQTGRAEQLHTQVVSAHMGTDGCMRGGRSFVAPLNLAMINPLIGPHINMKRCHVSRDGDLQGLRNSQRGSLLASAPPQPPMPGVLDQHFQIPGGWLRHSCSGSPLMSLSRGGAISMDECDKSSQRKPYRPSALDPAMANSTCWMLKIEREINTRKQGGIPGLVVLGPYSQPEPAHHPLLPRYIPSLFQIVPWWKS